MSAADLAFASASEQADLVKRREVSPVDLVRTYLDRIDRLDGQLHSYITVCRDSALADAAAAERAVVGGQTLGRLHGVPIGIKDQFLTKGVRTTNGMRSLADFVPDNDATAVARLTADGAILLGKLNMPESALVGTRDWPFGQPRNPWNHDHDAGASSTGGGIAVAAGLCAAALAEDTGGSIRGPASYNGVVGLRPSWGRVSCHGVMPLVWSLDTAGPMTRTVRDCALLLSTIAGHDPKDPSTADLPVPDYVGQLDRNVRGVRVGLVRELIDNSFIDVEVQATVTAAAKVLAGLGAIVEDVSLPLLTFAGTVFFVIADSGAAAQNRLALASGNDEFDAGPRRRMLAASLLPTAQYLKVEQARNLIRNQIRGAFADYDVLLSPTTPSPAARIDAAQPRTWTHEDLVRFHQRGMYTGPFSLAGVPALSIPCGFTRAGLPIGLQLVAKPFDEARLFVVADAYEGNNPTKDRRP
jgi:aspartyl-tRNA(Asn)/glutamyl-tRNA(Gln) amidotransferase subunit A